MKLTVLRSNQITEFCWLEYECYCQCGFVAMESRVLQMRMRMLVLLVNSMTLVCRVLEPDVRSITERKLKRRKA